MLCNVADWQELYEEEARISLLDRTGRCEQTLGRFSAAEFVHRKLLEQRREMLGEKHPSTLASMNEVGLALSDQGKYAEAEEMHRATLALSEEVSGKKHSSTLTVMNNLGLALSRQGKYEVGRGIQRSFIATKLCPSRSII
jgi:tetratricopeptide (TPR) repeat protein